MTRIISFQRVSAHRNIPVGNTTTLGSQQFPWNISSMGLCALFRLCLGRGALSWYVGVCLFCVRPPLFHHICYDEFGGVDLAPMGEG